MTHRAAVLAIVAATWALSACGVSSPDASGARATVSAPNLLVELQTLPHGHPPVPGYSSPLALPEGHPRCPASEALEIPPADAGMHHTLQSAPDLVST